MRGPLDIYAVGRLAARIDGELPVLRDLVKEACGRDFRRSNRFTQLALIGSNRCASGIRLDSSCGLYMASGQGALQDSVNVLQQIAIDGQPPKPLSFVNTLSNTPCFYVAQSLGLCGRNQFVSSSAFPFEAALTLAVLDFERNSMSQALIGGVDECILPLADHRKRLELGSEAPLGEGSHWLMLARECELAPIGELLAVREFPNWDVLAAWLTGIEIDPASWWLGCGIGLADSERARLCEATGIAHAYEYEPLAAYYDTVSAMGICSFLEAQGSATLLHINSSSDGRYAACAVHRHGR